MKLCRFDGTRLGVIEGERVYDITTVLDTLPALRWPLAPGDHVIRHISAISRYAAAIVPGSHGMPLESVHLDSPVANPNKVIAAPLNYAMHVSEVNQDKAIHHNTFNASFEGYRTPIDKLGLFLKGNSSVCGMSDGVRLAHADRRNDHEIELVVVIGTEAKNVSPSESMKHVAGYCIGLDMTVRGPEDRSFRKSSDSYTVLGPYLVTADEIENPNDLPFWLKVNDETRQQSSTRNLLVGIPELISLASRWYTLYPGDIIMTGTPDGVAPVNSGDVMEAWIGRIGTMRVSVL